MGIHAPFGRVCCAVKGEQGFGGPQGGSPPLPSLLSPRTVSPAISVGLLAALSYRPSPAHQELPLGVHHPLRKGGLCLLPDRPSRGAVAQQASSRSTGLPWLSAGALVKWVSFLCERENTSCQWVPEGKCIHAYEGSHAAVAWDAITLAINYSY